MTIGQAATAADPVSSSSSYWRIDYGNLRGPDPFNHRPVESRPRYISTLYFHSLPAALHSCFTWTPGSWWEILTPDGRVAVSSRAGVNEEVIGTSPSLIVQQLLHSRYGMFPESVEEGPRDRVSHDDGETWESILLGEKEEVRKPILPSLPKPESVEILTVSPSPEPGRIILTHATGSIAVKVSALELKRSLTSYSLQVLNTPRGTYTRDVGGVAAILLQSLGVQIAGEKEKLPKGFVRAWKPALFKIYQKEGEQREVRGWTRGLLGIDRRSVEVSNTYGEHTYTYTRLLYHLTHLPTGLLIASWKHKNTAQEFADLLRERMPEITDMGVEEVTPEMGKRVGEILDEYSA